MRSDSPFSQASLGGSCRPAGELCIWHSTTANINAVGVQIGGGERLNAAARGSTHAPRPADREVPFAPRWKHAEVLRGGGEQGRPKTTRSGSFKASATPPHHFLCTLEWAVTWQLRFNKGSRRVLSENRGKCVLFFH